VVRINFDYRGTDAARLISMCLQSMQIVLEWEFDEQISSHQLGFAAVEPVSSAAANPPTVVRPGNQ
jgi:hypothetical protein